MSNFSEGIIRGLAAIKMTLSTYRLKVLYHLRSQGTIVEAYRLDQLLHQRLSRCLGCVCFPVSPHCLIAAVDPSNQLLPCRLLSRPVRAGVCVHLLMQPLDYLVAGVKDQLLLHHRLLCSHPFHTRGPLRQKTQVVEANLLNQLQIPLQRYRPLFYLICVYLTQVDVPAFSMVETVFFRKTCQRYQVGVEECRLA